jgi:hypothetical protein
LALRAASGARGDDEALRRAVAAYGAALGEAACRTQIFTQNA